MRSRTNACQLAINERRSAVSLGVAGYLNERERTCSRGSRKDGRGSQFGGKHGDAREAGKQREEAADIVIIAACRFLPCRVFCRAVFYPR